MNTHTDTIHDNIVSSLKIKIDEALGNFESVIAERQKSCEEGSVPTAGNAYDSYIRNIRKKALLQFNGIKTWLGSHVLSTIIQQVQISGIYKLHELNEEIATLEADKEKILEERKSISDNSDSLSDFEKYLLYGHPEFELSAKWQKSDKNVHDSTALPRTVSPNVELVYRKYRSKKRWSLFLGLIVTIICIVIDFSMIYSLFLSANYYRTLAMSIAIISAAMLDAPPYLLGYIWTKNDDDKSLIELQNNSSTPEAKRRINGNRILLSIMLFVIVLSFIAYLLVRVFSFLGGGDFNITLHAFIESDWSSISNVAFSGADFLSTIVPLATSVVALAVGKTMYSMRTDYIKEAIVEIKNEINEKIKVCDNSIIDYERRIKTLKDSIVTLKQEIWTFYLGRKPFPMDDESFRTEVSLAFQKLNLSLYKQTYSDSCLFIRNQAIALLGTINEQLAQYAADQPRIIAMQFSKEEEEWLDDFWVIPIHGEAQHQVTRSHLDSIDGVVNEILDRLK